MKLKKKNDGWKMTWQIRLEFSDFVEMQKALCEIELNKYRGKYNYKKIGAGTEGQFEEK